MKDKFVTKKEAEKECGKQKEVRDAVEYCIACTCAFEDAPVNLMTDAAIKLVPDMYLNLSRRHANAVRAYNMLDERTIVLIDDNNLGLLEGLHFEASGEGNADTRARTLHELVASRPAGFAIGAVDAVPTWMRQARRVDDKAVCGYLAVVLKGKLNVFRVPQHAMRTIGVF
ncbi:hypothetical protein CYMTET_4212 [Cymbomonas tetramitiformis]|uniref:Uncharacterized protein n=1 Tax=Cymbomonas tetramitiformis TaxID=36881 RepID=A0AAE0H1N1_9CHLO|nr:hypothetical protein CYMTET_4212 [Cymbomonas tetramitiformis]